MIEHESPSSRKKLSELAEEAQRLHKELSQTDENSPSINSVGTFLEDVQQLLPPAPVTPNIGLSKEERVHYTSICDALKVVAKKHPDLYPKCVRFQIILSCCSDGFGMMQEIE